MPNGHGCPEANFWQAFVWPILDKLIGPKLDMKECHVAITNGDHIVVL